MLYATNMMLMSKARGGRRRAVPLAPAAHVSFRRVSKLSLIKRSAASVRLLNLLDGVQSVLAVISSVLWMLYTYEPFDSYRWLYFVQFVISVAYICDLLLRFAVSGLVYLRTRWAIFDALTSLPILWWVYELGWYCSNDCSTSANGWVAFITAMQVVWNFLVVARFLRVFKLLRITQLRSMTFLFPNALFRGLLSLLFTVAMIIVLGGGLVYLIESAWPYGEPFTYQEALYFMVVTISTVGYGDYSPKTVVGQIAVMLIILFAIIVVPMQTTEFISTVTDYYKDGTPYTRRSPHVVVVIPGDMSTDSLDSLLNEFFESNAGLLAWDVVLLSSGGEEHRQQLLAHVKSTQYWDQISYIVGTPNSTDDLDAAAVKTCQAVFLLTANCFDTAEKERQADELTLLRAISIKHYCPYVPLVISLNSPRNKGHVLWERLSLFSSVETVCLNELKLRLFAVSCLCPGAMGVVTNLCQSFDGASSFASLFVEPSSSVLMRTGERTSSLPAFAAQSLVVHPLDVSVWPLTAARCPAVPLPPQLDNSDASLFFSAATRRWDEEYLAGFGHRLYAVAMPAALERLCFSEAAAMLYERLTLVMIAVYRADAKTGKLNVILSPGYAVRVSILEGDLACVLAQSEEHAESMRDVSYPADSIRARWQAAQQSHAKDVSSTMPAQPAVTASPTINSFATAPTVVGLAALQPYEAYAKPQHEMKVQPMQQSSSPLSADCDLGFSCHGAPIQPIMPLSSAAAQSAVLRSDEMIASKGQGNPYEAAAGGLIIRHHSAYNAHHALKEYVHDPHDHIDPVTGRANVDTPAPPPAVSLQLAQPSRRNQPAPAVSAADGDPYRDHVVVCGIIDTRIITFIRRFRLSDARPIILVLHKPDTSFKEPVQKYIERTFSDVHVIHAEQDGPVADDEADTNHDDDALFLAYGSPCYGHTHQRSAAQEKRAAAQERRSEEDGEQEEQAPSMDEFSAEDEQVTQALHETSARANKADGGNGASESAAAAETAAQIYDALTGEALEYGAMLKKANWFRRACVHRAFSVLILANSYSSDVADGDGMVDIRAAADRDGLVLYSGIRAYLQQCRLRTCPLLPEGRHDTLVSIELLYHTNARMLKHNADASEPYTPDQPVESGLFYLYHKAKRAYQNSQNNLNTQGRHLRHRMADRRQQLKHAVFANLKHTSAAQEQLLDPQNDVGHSDATPKAQWLKRNADLDEAVQQQAEESNMRGFAQAFNTSDGLSFSSKLLDSLVVQAFYHPLVWDTVGAMVGGYTHRLTEAEEDRAIVAAAGGRSSFRVELLLLSLPEPFVGRTFGHLQLTLMLQCGWVAVGLYRDQQAVSAFGKATRQHARSVMQPSGDDGGSLDDDHTERQKDHDEVAAAGAGRTADDSGESDVVRQAVTGGTGRVLSADFGSLYYVLTNPPPDTILQARDRAYTYVQRWVEE